MKDNKKNTDLVLERFRQIQGYEYSKSLVTEQAVPPPEDPMAGEQSLEDPAAAPAGETLPPEGDPLAGDTPAEDPEAGDETPGDPLEAEPTDEDDTTEEIDITDLVDMIKDVKRNLDTEKGQYPAEIQKMDDVFSKLGELEGKLGEMDQVLAKIDALGAQIQSVKPPTPVEKLEMRSMDSYPFSQKPNEFFKEKQDEMRKSGKNEYVLTKSDVENYGKYDMMKSFNPSADNSLV